MKINTIKRLNQINQQFYQTIGAEFNQTRQYFWQGWFKLLPVLQKFPQLKVLDIGCGNARFFQFLNQELKDSKITYLGVDNNPVLLASALHHTQQLQTTDLVNALLEKLDFIKANDYTHIVSFAFLHHLPSFQLRRQLLDYLQTKLKPNGYLIISLWQFMEYDRFRKKIVDINNPKLNLNGTDLESNDYILDWQRGKTAYRYCHFINQQEYLKLIKQSKFKLVSSFQADGKEGKVNQYLVLQKI